jgi:choline dehydrogenase-like flavoprotein
MLDDIENIKWDAVIVGTGIGGGTLGFKLAEAGKKVLFVEKGKSHLNNAEYLSGKYAEMFFPKVERPEPHHYDILQKAGRWVDIIIDTSNARENPHIPFVGSGTGGSSALYGMVMERFIPDDFEGHTVLQYKKEDPWPISYTDLKPYYEQAERLYRVRGTVDSLRQEEIHTYRNPPGLSATNKEMFDFLKSKGFHPYQLPLACEFVPGCLNCQGFLCSKNCRNDSAKICVAPALQQFGAQLVDRCEVMKIEVQENGTSAVLCRWQGKTIKIQGKIIVLAAGALHTPAILLRSKSEKYPNGLANSSGQVGRNLMRHYIDIYAIAVKHKPGANDYLKQIAFNDLCTSEEGRFGTVQSFGKLPPSSIQVATVFRKLKESPLPFFAYVFMFFKPLVEFLVSRIFSERLILSSIMEDMPDPENRISISQMDEVLMHYKIGAHERKRIEIFRKKIKSALRPYSFLLIKQAGSNGRIAHVCGTCRFGSDPQSSVLNAVNQSHDHQNLFVVDSSFFPTSGGTNPALTIAANALRIADFIINQWTELTNRSNECFTQQMIR